jgi:uroporphyrinogen-III synthase
MNTPCVPHPQMASPLLVIDASNRFSREHTDVAFLHATTGRIAQTIPVGEILKEVVEFVTSVTQCDSCFVYALEGDDLVLGASKNPYPEVVDRVKMKTAQGVTGWVGKHGKSLAISQAAYKDPRFRLFNELPEDRFEAFLSVPVIMCGRLLGIVNLQSRAEHQYTEHEISLVSMIGFLAGAKIERARLESENELLRDKLETRTLVERAKGILQRDLKITEEAAYRVMQRESQERRKSMREMAEAVILSDSLKASPCAVGAEIAASRVSESPR